MRYAKLIFFRHIYFVSVKSDLDDSKWEEVYLYSTEQLFLHFYTGIVDSSPRCLEKHIKSQQI